MRLTILNKLKVCFEVLTIASGHKHIANEKQLSTFKKGYDAGFKDAMINVDNHWKPCSANDGMRNMEDCDVIGGSTDYE